MDSLYMIVECLKKVNRLSVFADVIDKICIGNINYIQIFAAKKTCIHLILILTVTIHVYQHRIP